MKSTKYLIILLFALFSANTIAQPDYNLRFDLVSTNGSTYVIDIIMSYTSAGGLGTSNLVFSYNGADISSPTLVSHNLSNHYSVPTVTTPAASTASLNIELNITNSGIPIGVFPVETNLARVSFTIDNPNGNSNLEWQPANPLHVVFLDNDTDILTANNLESLNTNPLPLELLLFKARPESSFTHLIWQSANETNFQGFEVQRSTNGNDFFKIGWQAGLGGQWAQDYSFTDSQVWSGLKYYYRLKQIHEDGSFDFSKIIEAQIINELPPVQAFPNPNNGAFHIKKPVSSERPLFIEIIDAQGRTVRQASSVNNETQITGLPAGPYILQVSDGLQIWRERVVVQ
ncbi:MAG: T9SS type A sorting domain-containing protein [Bacteroidota bacterium]